MAWQCRRWSQIFKVDERDRIVPTSTWEHQCLRQFGPHRSTFVVATVRPAEWEGWDWQVRVPYKPVASGSASSRKQAMHQADKALRESKSMEEAKAGIGGRR